MLIVQRVLATALDLVQPDRVLLAACAEFRRLDAVLASIPYEHELATDIAWAARQAVANQIAALRPETDRGRRERAAIAVTLMLEIPDWQQDAEVLVALLMFGTEARA
jgi:hypothetical protein